ncbi:MAG: diaminobutyrate--2-oxoglutarate transaminase [Planctomycetes bacterium]|nr:diaminobutyrate--2-oxoglutarate transaminase [Planctomycetota bacterium]
MNDIFARNESKVQSYARSFPVVFNRALGTELWDAQGRRYLDFLAGAGSLNYGHNNPVLKRALIDYIESDAITHSLDLHTAAKEKFLEAFQEIILAPRGLDYVVQFTGPTGTNAVEAALKLARKATGRTNVIFFTNGFHGVSSGALAVTGNEYFRRAAGMPLMGGTSMPYDGYMGDEMDTIAYLDRMLADRSSGIDMPAAVIVETVQGEGGLNAARCKWLRRLQSLCNERGIVFIVDDIQAGCGRTGTFFSFEPAGIKPDMVTLSKSLSGYGLPFSVVLIKRSLDMWKPAEHNGTFRGNNHAFVTATAALEHYWRTPDFAEEVAEKSEHLRHRLETMIERFSPDLIKVKGRGMMQGILCADPKRAAAITANAFRHGLIIERAGPEDEVIKCLMPLTTSYEILDEGLDILENALEEECVRSGGRCEGNRASAA